MKKNYSLTLFRSALVLVIGCAFLLPGSARAQTQTVVMTGLHNPRGIAFAPDGALYVAESGCSGNTSDCAIPPNPSDQERVATEFPSLSAAAQGGGNAIGPTDISPVQTGTVYQLYTTIGLQGDPAFRTLADIGPLFAQLAHIPPSTIFPYAQGPGIFTADWLIADIGNYEAQQNPDGGPFDTNPYGLLSLTGAWIVADAGGNSLLRVDGSGEISTLAVFPSRAQGRRFNGVLIDAVPTSVAVGPDGAYYVGELTGSPFFNGAANIYRVIPNGVPIVDPEVYLSGFKSVIDIAFDANGNLYVLQFATGATGLPANSGVLKRVELNGCTTAPNDCPRTDVVSGLNRPTSFAIAPDGSIYVTNNGTSPTAGEVLRIEP